MPLRKAGRVLIALGALFALYLIVRQLPVVPLVMAGATLLHGMGCPGIFATGAAIYLLTLFMLPIIPLIVACGWLYGPWGGAISLAAAVASAATSFSLARALGGSAAAQALMDRPRAKALAELAAEGGIKTVALVRLAPILPYTPSNAVLGLTAMRLRDLLLGTFFGLARGVALSSGAGSLLPSAEAIESGEPLRAGYLYVLFGVAFVAAAILGV